MSHWSPRRLLTSQTSSTLQISLLPAMSNYDSHPDRDHIETQIPLGTALNSPARLDRWGRMVIVAPV
jgi:hypothetical protein